MPRLLATGFFAYAVLAAAHWGEASLLLHGSLRCGNAVSDPYMQLVNVWTPLAAVANAALVHRGVKSRRWPMNTIAATLAFMATSGGLAYEGYLLSSEYWVPLGDVWWLPWL